MAVIETGNTGKPLKDIIAELGNKSYPFIECRCKWTENDEEHDEFFGECAYDNETKELKSLDGDNYSLEDLYEEYEEWLDEDEEFSDGGQFCLTVWEHGVVKEEEKEREI